MVYRICEEKAASCYLLSPVKVSLSNNIDIESLEVSEVFTKLVLRQG